MRRSAALLVVGTTPALAKGITGIEPASRAERAAGARPNALDSKVYGVT